MVNDKQGSKMKVIFQELSWKSDRYFKSIASLKEFFDILSSVLTHVASSHENLVEQTKVFT